MPLCILHISTRLILGGSQENTVLSCEGQARLGHEVHLAFGPIFGPEGSMLDRVKAHNHEVAQLSELGSQLGELCHPITTHEVPDLVREINPWRDRKCLKQLRSLILAIQPDIVHTHSSKAGILGRAAAWTVAKRQRTKLPKGQMSASRPASDPPTSDLAIWPSGHLAICHTIHGPPFHKYLPKHKNAIYVLAERYAAKRCHLIVSVADAMTEQFLARKIGKPEQYVTVRSGMEIEPFIHAAPGESREEIRQALGLKHGDLVIGTVSRLAELKGHDDLLDALADDLKAHRNWKLLWVGDGWWRDRLLARVRELGLSEQVLTTGLVAPEKIPGLIRAMDILAHPSYREGLPRAVTQAMLAQTAVIANDVDGTKEVCIDGETGILVQPGDIRALREGIVFLADNPEQREAMIRRGHERCVIEFSAQTMVDDLEKVYARAIELAKA